MDTPGVQTPPQRPAFAPRRRAFAAQRGTVAAQRRAFAAQRPAFAAQRRGLCGAKASLCGAKGGLCAAKETRCGAKAQPRAAKADPGPATASPGAAKAEPRAAKAEPRAAKAGPRAAKDRRGKQGRALIPPHFFGPHGSQKLMVADSDNNIIMSSCTFRRFAASWRSSSKSSALAPFSCFLKARLMGVAATTNCNSSSRNSCYWNPTNGQPQVAFP
jgi:hypothetical protein